MTEYNAASIDVHEGLDGVRQNLNVYVSENDSEGIFKCWREPIVNVFDEFRNGHGKILYVIVDKGSLWVSDQARGIPTDIHPKTKKPAVTTVLTSLSSGGKMKKEGSAYGGKATAGVHGMGIAITNAASRQLQVWVMRKGQCVTQTFAKGKETSGLVKSKPPTLPFVNVTPKQGTTVRFIPDMTLFEAGSTLDMARVRAFLDLSSYTHPGLQIILVTPKSKTVYHQPEGTKAYLAREVDKAEGGALSKPFFLQTDVVDVALQWVKGDAEVPHAFVNSTPTVEGGTHVNGLTKALSEVLDPYAPKRAKYKPEDLRAGLVYFLNAEVFNPKFTTQVKDKLRTPEAATIVYNALLEPLRQFFDKNKMAAKEITKRAGDFAKVNEDAAARKRSVAGLASAKNKKSLPAKLSHSTTKNPEERWLYLVEGDSAAGSAVNARDSYYQEILRMRGKILNVFTAKDSQIYTNEEVKSFLSAVGYDPTATEQTYRVGRVIVMTDEDVDGNHISILILSVILKKMPDLIDKGMVYILRGYLFTGEDRKGKRYYADTLEDLKKQAGDSLVTKTITRMKGWGEAQAAWLVDMAFNENSKLLKIMPSSKTDIEKYIRLVSGGPEGVAQRFKLLTQYGRTAAPVKATNSVLPAAKPKPPTLRTQ